MMKNLYINTFEKISYMFLLLPLIAKFFFQLCDIVEMAIIHKMFKVNLATY
jgi:hypothetical protein